MEVDLDGTLKWRVEGQLLFKETEASAELGDQDRRHWTCEQIVC